MRQVLEDKTIHELLNNEWLLSNNLGAYSASSLSGANTRRYHGLLIAAFDPPGERKVIVSRVEEEITFDNRHFELGCSIYPGNVVSPTGVQYLNSFENEAFPVFTYAGADWKLTKKIVLAQDANACYVQYENLSEIDFQLKLTPFLVYRDYHRLFTEDSSFDFYAEFLGKQSMKIFPCYQAHPIYFQYSKGEFTHGGVWYKNHFYQQDADRGFEPSEDSYALGTINLSLEPGEKVNLVFSTLQSFLLAKADKVLKEQEVKIKNLSKPYKKDQLLADLVIASEAFIVERNSCQSPTLLAGYHWFLDWGRDTLIALRGIGIATGRQSLCKSILGTFLKYLDQGMLPNRFPDEGELPEYNTVDAALWLFIALYEFDEAFDDKEFIENHFDALGEILNHYASGTRYGIKLTQKGFIQAGEGNSNLTWMDAVVGGTPVTPRHGCAVEINMLWYNALKIYESFQKKYQLQGTSVVTWVELFEKHFVSSFYNDQGYLMDVIQPNDEGGDASIRPNQIYALSLPFTVLNKSQAASVLECVRVHLLTDYGLRSLSPSDPQFVAVYAGGPEQRDAAYHQGTVWVFLIQEYYTAYLKHHELSNAAKAETLEALQPLIRHFYNDGCIGGVAEIFDGLEPSSGKGCVHQAWSISALISLLLKTGTHRSVNKKQK